MKADRCVTTAAVLLAGLLAASHPAAGQFTLSFGRQTITVESSSKKMAKALAQQVGEVQKRFDKNRRALRSVRGSNGEPAYSQDEVAGLVARTGKDLDQAIEQVGEPGLDGLRAWATEELRRIQDELAAQTDRIATWPSGLSTPRAVARVASLEAPPLPRLANVSSAAPQGTISAEKSDRLLDQVGEVVGRIFVLAKKEDLEVELWVGSTPVQEVAFLFSPQGRIQGSTQEPIIRTDGKQKHVLRGLYRYRAAWTQGSVTELIAYPNPAGPSAGGLASERLDLVNGSSFFCCDFDAKYCHHVDTKKECRP